MRKAAPSSSAAAKKLACIRRLNSESESGESSVACALLSARRGTVAERSGRITGLAGRAVVMCLYGATESADRCADSGAGYRKVRKLVRRPVRASPICCRRGLQRQRQCHKARCAAAQENGCRWQAWRSDRDESCLCEGKERRGRPPGCRYRRFVAALRRERVAELFLRSLAGE